MRAPAAFPQTLPPVPCCDRLRPVCGSIGSTSSCLAVLTAALALLHRPHHSGRGPEGLSGWQHRRARGFVVTAIGCAAPGRTRRAQSAGSCAAPVPRATRLWTTWPPNGEACSGGWFVHSAAGRHSSSQAAGSSSSAAEPPGPTFGQPPFFRIGSSANATHGHPTSTLQDPHQHKTPARSLCTSLPRWWY